MSERNDLLLLKDIENAGTQILVYCRDIIDNELAETLKRISRIIENR